MKKKESFVSQEVAGEDKRLSYLTMGDGERMSEEEIKDISSAVTLLLQGKPQVPHVLKDREDQQLYSQAPTDAHMRTLIRHHTHLSGDDMALYIFSHVQENSTYKHTRCGEKKRWSSPAMGLALKY